MLNEKRGNFKIQEKFAGADAVVDQPLDEVRHHGQALCAAGHDVHVIDWGPTLFETSRKLRWI